MRGKELIKFEGMGFNGFPNYRNIDIIGISDIGYSEKILKLEGGE